MSHELEVAGVASRGPEAAGLASRGPAAIDAVSRGPEAAGVASRGPAAVRTMNMTPLRSSTPIFRRFTNNGRLLHNAAYCAPFQQILTPTPVTVTFRPAPDSLERTTDSSMRPLVSSIRPHLFQPQNVTLIPIRCPDEPKRRQPSMDENLVGPRHSERQTASGCCPMAYTDAAEESI